MLDLNFWLGFSFGVGTMFVIAASITVWFVIQAANFHDSWLEKKEKQ